jgi:hypothetical protein
VGLASSVLPGADAAAPETRLSLRRVFLVSLNSQRSGWPSATHRLHGCRPSWASGTHFDLRFLQGSQDW